MTQKSAHQKTVRQIIVYLAVGGGTALLELALFELLYEVLRLDVAPSNVTAVLIATATNFILNGKVTFGGSHNIVRSVVLYMLLFLFNLCFTTWAIGALVGLGIHSAAAKIMTQICVTIWNYVLYRKVVFV